MLTRYSPAGDSDLGWSHGEDVVHHNRSPRAVEKEAQEVSAGGRGVTVLREWEERRDERPTVCEHRERRKEPTVSDAALSDVSRREP
jgi:hypothetical protein